jgi:hypothetical protein
MTNEQPLITPPTGRKPKGHSLTPKWGDHGESIFDGRYYWIGILPSMEGLSSIAIGGLSFPLIEEIIGKTADGRTSRTPMIGALVNINKAKIEHVRECLSRLVVRWHQHKGVDREGNPISRRAEIIKIPKTADVDAMKAKGRALSPYYRRPTDEPAARYMFAVPCKNQDEGERGMNYPDCLETTDLKWPRKAADASQ